jgi:hypothetical protein
MERKAILQSKEDTIQPLETTRRLCMLETPTAVVTIKATREVGAMYKLRKMDHM